MKHIFELKDIPGAIFEMESSVWTGKSTLQMNGTPIKQSKEKGKPFLIPKENGEILKAFPKPALPDFIPTLLINGEKNQIAKKLKLHEYIIGGLPILLIFMGGIIGGAIGALAAIKNFGILRQEGSTPMKYIKVVGITIVAYLVYSYAITTFIRMFY